MHIVLSESPGSNGDGDLNIWLLVCKFTGGARNNWAGYMLASCMIDEQDGWVQPIYSRIDANTPHASWKSNMFLLGYTSEGKIRLAARISYKMGWSPKKVE